MFIRINRDKNNPLVMSYMKKDIKQFKKLINNGENVNCLYDGKYSLISAVIANYARFINNNENKKFFNALMDAKVHLGKIGDEKMLLWMALEHQNDIYYMKRLLESKNEKDYIYERTSDEIEMVNEPHIFTAIRSEDINKINLLINKKINLHNSKKNNEPVLNYLINRRNKSLSKLLPKFLQLGANPNDCDISGRNALHSLAMHNSNDKLCEILLKYIKNINACDTYGNTPIMYASRYGFLNIINLLTKNNADLDIQNRHKKTAAMMSFDVESIDTSKFDTLKLLVEKGADLSKQDIYGDTVAHYVAYNRHYIKDLDKYLELFKNNDITMYLKNESGITVKSLIEKV